MRVAAILLSAAAILAAGPMEAARAARQWRERNEHAILTSFIELLRIPNVASDRANIRRNADLIMRILGARGVAARLLEVPNANPAIYGERLTPSAARTILFYTHYDGQPVEPRLWDTGDPFRPVLKSGAQEISLPPSGGVFDPEWRLYARSSSDDKAPVIAIAAALDALDTAKIPLTSNIKFLLDGEEEAGSPNLERIVLANRAILAGDLWVFCDGPMHQNRAQQINFGVRGIQRLGITVYGARRELHSGHYGNWAPNPAMMLARLLASMKDDEGRVLIEGFYDGIEPLGETEKRALDAAPDFDDELRRELLLARTEGDRRRLDQLINLPSLNIRGLESAAVGAQSRNVVPAEATASIDLRLVKGITPERQAGRVITHIRKQGYYVVEREPDPAARLKHPKIARVEVGGGYNAARTPMDLPIARQLYSAVRAARGEVIRMPILGGTVPIFIFTDVLKTPTIIVPIANHDNNQHSHNENIRLRNLWDGIETMAAILAME